MNKNIPEDFGLTNYLNNRRCNENYFERIISGKTIDNPLIEQTKEERDYDNYLKNWLLTNNISNQDFVDEIATIQNELFIEKRKPISTIEAYEQVIVNGFNGRVWDSKDKWLENNKEIDEVER